MKLAAKTARFAILARVSTREQIAGHSLEVQDDLCRKYVKKAGGEVARVYSAQESATTEDRKVLPQVLADAGTTFTDLVFEELTRLSRNPATMFHAITHLSSQGVRIHTLNGPLDTSSPEGEFQVMINSVIGRFTARQGVKKSINARLHILRNGGIAAGRPPWGRRWNADLKRFEIIEARQEQMRAAYDLIVKQNKSVIQAAAALDLAASSLRKAINQSDLTKVRQQLADEQFEFPCPPLLTWLEKRRLVKRIRDNAVVRPAIKGTYLLQGLVRCGNCQSTMTGQTSNKNRQRYTVYRHPPKRMQEGCTWAVPVDLLDDDVLTACADVVKDGEALRDAIKTEMSQRRPAGQDLEGRKRRLEETVARHSKQLDQLVDTLGELDKAGAAHLRTKARIDRLEKQLTEAQAELTDVAGDVAEMQVPQADADSMAAQLRSLYWASGRALSVDGKRAFLRTMIGAEKNLGVFVQMHRRKDGKLKDVFWHYQVNGLIGSLDNYLERHGESPYPEPTEVRTPTAAVLRGLGAIATRSSGIHGVKSGLKCSSGA